MNHIRVGALALAVTIAFTAVLNQASAVNYTASILNTPGFSTAEAIGISGGSIVGAGNTTSTGNIDASVWNPETNGFVD
jgi:hypothetical protein